MQTGTSPAGREFAARHAEITFTAPQTLDSARRFQADVREPAAAEGRPSPKVLAGVCPVVTETDAQARESATLLDSRTDPEVGLAHLRSAFGIDLTSHDLDGRVDPSVFIDPTPAADSVKKSQRTHRRTDSAYATDVAAIVDPARTRSGGHLVGSAERTAELMHTWFTAGGCDGFIVMPPTLPDGLIRFTDHAVPLLQDRGNLRSHYRGATLHSHFDIEKSGGRRCRS